MTFEEWCKENYVNNRYSAFSLLRQCWVRATQEERERCAKFLEEHEVGLNPQTGYVIVPRNPNMAARHTGEKYAEEIRKGA